MYSFKNNIREISNLVNNHVLVHCATRVVVTLALLGRQTSHSQNKCFSRVAHDFFSTIGSESGFVCPDSRKYFLFMYIVCLTIVYIYSIPACNFVWNLTTFPLIYNYWFNNIKNDKIVFYLWEIQGKTWYSGTFLKNEILFDIKENYIGI